MKIVFKYLREFYGRMTVGLIIKITGTLAELMLPYILRKMHWRKPQYT